jgi:hypothetical protein
MTDKMRLTPLTVGFQEPAFLLQANEENREILQFGQFFQWSDEVRQKHNVPSGPANPQALNRYSYVLNNPLRYTDPTGHDGADQRSGGKTLYELAAPSVNSYAH